MQRLLLQGRFCIGIGEDLSMEQAFLGVWPLGRLYISPLLTLLNSVLHYCNYQSSPNLTGNFFIQVDIVGDKVDTEKIINSLMDENFPSLALTDQYSYKISGELNKQQCPKKTSTRRNRQLQLQFTVRTLTTIFTKLTYCNMHRFTIWSSLGSHKANCRGAQAIIIIKIEVCL